MGSSLNQGPCWAPGIVRHPYEKDPKRGPYFRELPISNPDTGVLVGRSSTRAFETRALATWQEDAGTRGSEALGFGLLGLGFRVWALGF